jgi:DNA-binding GntR family transcriptional regulator
MKVAVFKIKSKVKIPESFFYEVHEEHKHIVEAFRKRDPKAAHDAMANHIFQVEKSLKVITGDFLLTGGRPDLDFTSF